MVPPQRTDELRRRTEEALAKAAQARAKVAEALAEARRLLRRPHWVVDHVHFLGAPPKPVNLAACDCPPPGSG